jgi:hypothetical protein
MRVHVSCQIYSLIGQSSPPEFACFHFPTASHGPSLCGCPARTPLLRLGNLSSLQLFCTPIIPPSKALANQILRQTAQKHAFAKVPSSTREIIFCAWHLCWKWINPCMSRCSKYNRGRQVHATTVVCVHTGYSIENRACDSPLTQLFYSRVLLRIEEVMFTAHHTTASTSLEVTPLHRLHHGILKCYPAL